MILVALLLLQDIAGLSSQGAAAMREKRYTEAARIYRELAVRDAANPMWHLNLALALHSSGEYRAALLETGVFLRARPDPGPGHYIAGLAHLKLKEPCEAIAPLEKAKAWQSTRQILIELGDAQQGCKYWDAAAASYEAAAKAGPPAPKIARQAAYCWWMARRYDKARPLYAATENAFDKDAEFQYEFGDTLARLDGAQAGLPRLEKAISLAPGMIAAQGALGRALVELNRYAEAAPYLEAASLEDPALLLPLSRAYKALGRAADAAQAEADYKKRMAARQN